MSNESSSAQIVLQMKDETQVKEVKCNSVIVRISTKVANYYWCAVLSSCDNLQNDMPGMKA
jgi:hypothetical protein